FRFTSKIILFQKGLLHQAPDSLASLAFFLLLNHEFRLVGKHCDTGATNHINNFFCPSLHLFNIFI
ncbi:MAG: hypothetical protein ACI9RP_000593, partial [Cyclobacteriaceae bacterium]